MGSLGRRLASATAVALGVLLVASGLTAPAEAVTKRTLTMAASPTTAITGTHFFFRGHLSKSPVGATVKIQRKVGTRWVSVTSTKTLNSTGYFGVKVTAPTTVGKLYFRAAAGASRTLSSAYSSTVPVTVLRRVWVSINASPSTIELGDTTTISGHLSRYRSGDVGFIQRFNGVKWIDLTTATISSTGNYRRTFTPQATTTYRFYVPKDGLNGPGYSAGVQVLIPSGPVPPTITTNSLPGGVTETAYSQTLTKTGDPGTWSITGGSLPPGLTLGSSSGTIAGTPTSGGTYNFTVTFSQTDNFLSASKQLSITVQVKPKITTTALPAATAFSNYTASVAKTGNPGTWAITAGTLPAGVSFDTATGALSGKPTVSGSFPLTFKFTETDSGLSASKSLPLTVNPAPDPVITTSSLPNATAYSNYSTQLVRTGNAGTWSIMSGSLPTGLSLDPATGIISGKPTASGDFPLTFKFTETESGTFDTRSLPLHVNPAPNPTINTTSLPNAQAYSNYSTTLSRSGNAGTWSISSGSLPNGLTLDPATGEISGKPTVSGDFPLTFKFTETESGTFATKSLPLHVNPAPNPVITTTTLPSVLINAAYSVQLNKTGNDGTWSITAGALPSGVTLDAATGLISGSPTVSGTFNFTARFTEDESGTFDTQALSLLVYSRPTITTVGLPDALKDNAYSASLTKTGGSGSGTWSLQAGSSLPTGISLSGSGSFSGTPTVNGDYSFTVRFADSVTGATTTKVLSIHVGPTAIRTASLADGKVGTPYSVQFDGAPGGLGGWNLDSGTLPPGLTFSPSGVLSGTPTTAGDYTFAVTYSVLLKPSRTRTFTLHINP